MVVYYYTMFVPESCLSIHLPMDCCLGTSLSCSQVLAIVNNAAMNIGVHIFFQISVFIFFRKIPIYGYLDHMVVLFLIISGTSILFSIVAVANCSPTNNVRRFPFLYILSNTSYFFVFLIITIQTSVR